MEPKSHDRTCSRCGATIAPAAAEGWCTRCLLESAATATEGPGSLRGRVDPPPVAAIAGAFPQLEVVELIGAGGMGAVYKARQARLDRWVALKVLPAELGRQPAFAERFLREARVLARLNHPNIVTVHDYGQAGDFCYLLMEYVDGANLRQAMRAGRFRPGQALELVPQICAALQFAHDAGVMHRDIKPENILLDARGRVKLVDFGIAKLLGHAAPDPALTVTGAAVGTPQYMAPEQIERPADVDHRADIYSLGVVFYELLTGELPLGRFAAPSDKTPLDARVDEIVLRALAKERELRQQSANEVRSAVEAVGDGRPTPGAGGSAKEEQEPEAPRAIPEWPAPLWAQSTRYRAWTLVLLWAGAVANGYILWPGLRHLGLRLPIDPVAMDQHVVGMLVGWALVAWGTVRVAVGAPVWLRPLRCPGGAEEVGLNQAVWCGTLLAIAVFGLECLIATVLAAGSVVAIFETAIRQQTLSMSTSLGALGILSFPVVLIAGWIRGMQSARRPGSVPTALPPWGLGFAVAVLSLQTGSVLLVAWQRALIDASGPLVVSGTWSAAMPVVLAWWTGSRFWRTLGLYLTGYGVVLGLVASVLSSLAVLGLSGDEAGAVRPYHLVATLGMTLVQILAWYGLRRREVRQAFGCQPDRATPAGPQTPAKSVVVQAGHGTDPAAV